MREPAFAEPGATCGHDADPRDNIPSRIDARHVLHRRKARHAPTTAWDEVTVRTDSDVFPFMPIWQGKTPDGYALRVERDSRHQWVVTVASVSRSRNDSLETALMEAGGSSVSREWAARVAAVIAAHEMAGKAFRTKRAQFPHRGGVASRP